MAVNILMGKGLIHQEQAASKQSHAGHDFRYRRGWAMWGDASWGWANKGSHIGAEREAVLWVTAWPENRH